MRNPVRSSGFRLEFIPYLIRGRNDELAASGGEYNPKGLKIIQKTYLIQVVLFMEEPPREDLFTSSVPMRRILIRL